MEAWLAGRGYWVAWVTAALANVMSNPENGWWSRWCFVAAVVAMPVAVLASSVKGAEVRRLHVPPRWAATLRATVVRLRWPLVVAYVALVAVTAQRRYDSVAVTLLATVAAASAAAYLASRVRPEPVPVRSTAVRDAAADG